MFEIRDLFLLISLKLSSFLHYYLERLASVCNASTTYTTSMHEAKFSPKYLRIELIFIVIDLFVSSILFFPGKIKKEPHIKKPLNAFMLYMKEMRPIVQAECTLKESAAINQILGRRVRRSTRN